MASTDLLINPQAQRLLQCLEDSLSDHPSPPLVISMRAGDHATMGITFDRKDECACGYAWARWMGTFPSEEASFPGPTTSTQPGCGVNWAARFELGIVRCAPDPTSYISPEVWQDLHLKLMLDSASLRQALCCFTNVSPPWRYSLSEITPTGPEGLCVGVRTEVAVLLDGCNDC